MNTPFLKFVIGAVLFGEAVVRHWKFVLAMLILLFAAVLVLPGCAVLDPTSVPYSETAEGRYWARERDKLIKLPQP